jgi:hypothetical protein
MEVGDIQGQEDGEEERKGGYMWKGLEGKMGLFGFHPLQKSCHRSVYELCKMSASLL